MNLPLKDVIALIPSDQIITIFPYGIDTNTDEYNDLFVQSVRIDSRTIETGALFFAFVGDAVDGHSYINTAFKKGAVLAIGTKPLFDLHIDPAFTKGIYIQTQDTLLCLQGMAKSYREQYLQATSIIGVTGSVGKTTVKDMLKGALRSLQPYSTTGNLNNHIGVPLSILSIPVSTSCAILEGGMNHRGEMTVLAKIMQPDIVVITQIGVAHIEYLKTQEEIALEKLDLAVSSPRAYMVLVPSTDMYVKFIADNLQVSNSVRPNGFKKIIFVATVNSSNIKINLNLPGEHMVSNAQLAYACARIFNIDSAEIIAGIESSTITPRRLQVHSFKHNITLIDDTYNANPDSMRAGLSVCNTYINKNSQHEFTKRIAILGGMAELGELSGMMHREIAESFAEFPAISQIYYVGDLARQYLRTTDQSGIQSQKKEQHFKTAHECIAYIKDTIIEQKTNPEDRFENILFFIKGSKSTQMSNLADLLLEEIEQSIK